MTLAELISAIRQLSPTDKLELFHILKAELDTNEDISPLEPFKTGSSLLVMLKTSIN